MVIYLYNGVVDWATSSAFGLFFKVNKLSTAFQRLNKRISLGILLLNQGRQLLEKGRNQEPSEGIINPRNWIKQTRYISAFE